jgi:hypothetical protein
VLVAGHGPEEDVVEEELLHHPRHHLVHFGPGSCTSTRRRRPISESTRTGDTAEALGVSPRTVKGDWALARAWLHDALSGEEG